MKSHKVIKRLLPLMLMLAFAGSIAVNDEPFLEYEWQGGYSPYKQVHVVILKTGSVRVTGEKQGLPPVDYQTVLSPGEIAALRTLIRSTDFFNQPDQDTNFATDVGETVLTVQMDGSTRTLIYRYRPSMEPLIQPIWKLITQAFALQAIASDGDIYTATGTVMPTRAGSKSLQPQALKAPLMSYIRDHNERQKVEWALEALAWITTAEEFSGFISMGIEDQSQKDILLRIIGSHPFYDNIPDSHLKALCPVYLSFVRNARERFAQLSVAEKEALSDFTRLLGETRYLPAIPMLKNWFEKHDQPYITESITPLAKMGVASLEVLAPYLESHEEIYRINAIELITIASRLGPNGVCANPLMGYEFGRMIQILNNTVIPRLHDMSGNDPSAAVRLKAGEAMKEIIRQIE